MHRAVFTDEISRALGQGETAADVAARLLTVAKARGAIENATVLVGRDLLTLDAPGRRPRSARRRRAVGAHALGRGRLRDDRRRQLGVSPPAIGALLGIKYRKH